MDAPPEDQAEPNPHLLRRLYDWVLTWADSPHGTWALFGLAVAEASFFPVPPDVLLLALGMARPDRALRYAGVATAGSVLGGIAGYGMGAWLLRPVLVPLGETLGIADGMARAAGLYHRWDFWAVFGAGLTPIPYKVFTLLAGFFWIDFPRFVVASILSRGLRFLAIGALLTLVGPAVRRFVDRWFDLLAVAFLVLLVGGFLLLGGTPARPPDPAVVEEHLELLEAPTEETRAEAVDALRRETGRFHGFDPGGPPAERERAVERWREWWRKERPPDGTDDSEGPGNLSRIPSRPRAGRG